MNELVCNSYTKIFTIIEELYKDEDFTEAQRLINNIRNELSDNQVVRHAQIVHYIRMKDYSNALKGCNDILSQIEDTKAKDLKVLCLNSLMNGSKSPDDKRKSGNSGDVNNPMYDVYLNNLKQHLIKYPDHNTAKYTIIKSLLINNRVPEVRDIIDKYGNEMDKIYSKIFMHRQCLSGDDIIKQRDEHQSNLNEIYEQVKGKGMTLPNELIHLNLTHFYLSYQGHNNRKMFTTISNILREVYPDLNYISPKCKDVSYKNTKKINIGFISKMISSLSSVYRDRSGIISELPSTLFNTTVILMSEPSDDFSKQMCSNVDKYIVLNESSGLLGIRKDVEKLDLDILVYCDIGMYPLLYLLAHNRIAPIQLNTWGHSDTSGIDTIDYFISSKYYEHGENINHICDDSMCSTPQNHYSEKLIMLDSMCTHYRKPIAQNIIDSFKPREYFYLPKDTIIFMSPHSIFKYNIDYLKMVKNILSHNDAYRIIFLKSHSDKESRDFYNNLSEILCDRMKQVIIHDRDSFVNTQNLINSTDIILDSYPFGGCNVSLESFNMCKPIVTLPSDVINGRFTYGFYEKMGIMDLIAKDKDDYVKISIRLADDKLFRNNIINKIKSKRDCLFNEVESVKTWMTMCTKLTRQQSINKNSLLDMLL